MQVLKFHAAHYIHYLDVLASLGWAWQVSDYGYHYDVLLNLEDYRRA